MQPPSWSPHRLIWPSSSTSDSKSLGWAGSLAQGTTSIDSSSRYVRSHRPLRRYQSCSFTSSSISDHGMVVRALVLISSQKEAMLQRGTFFLGPYSPSSLRRMYSSALLSFEVGAIAVGGGKRVFSQESRVRGSSMAAAASVVGNRLRSRESRMP